MRATVSPTNRFHFRPAFWGVERDLSDVVNRMESIWDNQASKVSNYSSDFKETEKAYLVSIDMPGVSKNDLNVEVQEERIMINGTRKKSPLSEEEKDEKVFRVLTLPPNVDREKIMAHIEDGVLYVAMPKIEKEKPRKIELSEGFQSNSWNKLLES